MYGISGRVPALCHQFMSAGPKAPLTPNVWQQQYRAIRSIIMNNQSRCQSCNLQAHSGSQLCRAQRHKIPMRMRNTELAFPKVEISGSYSNAQIRSAIKKSYNSKIRWWIRASRFSKLTHNLFEVSSGLLWGTFLQF
jgi:hypothetical protein